VRPDDGVRRFVLWDIDGTLVDSARLGRESFRDAFHTMFGRLPAPLGSLNGRTDHEIALNMLAENGVPDPERCLDAFSGELAAALAGKADLIRERGGAYPGAKDVLERLAREPGVIQSLLTGNLEANAFVKLNAFGLVKYVDLEIGAYGSDHRLRSELVAVARRKARAKYGVEFAPAATVVIGDTPLDVAAARAAGAVAVGVASGPFGEKELSEAGADVVLPDLLDAESVSRAVLGP
jgi:phosphoglycolate phosphatase-like HAD superfamily hydrolase